MDSALQPAPGLVLQHSGVGDITKLGVGDITMFQPKSVGDITILFTGVGDITIVGSESYAPKNLDF